MLVEVQRRFRKRFSVRELRRKVASVVCCQRFFRGLALRNLQAPQPTPF